MKKHINNNLKERDLIMKKRNQRWQDWVNLIAGIWLFITPWLFNYARTGYSWDAFLFGFIMIIFSIWAISDRRLWEEWVDSIIGIWVFISPWVLSFSFDYAALWNFLAVGFVATILSIWNLAVAPKVETSMT